MVTLVTNLDDYNCGIRNRSWNLFQLVVSLVLLKYLLQVKETVPGFTLRFLAFGITPKGYLPPGLLLRNRTDRPLQ